MFAKVYLGYLKLQNWFMVVATTGADALLNSSSAQSGSGAASEMDELLNPSNAQHLAGGALEEIDELVKGYGSAGVSITKNIFIYLALFGFLCSGIAMIVHAGDVAKRGNAKEAVAWRVVGCVLGGASVSIAVALLAIGENLL